MSNINYDKLCTDLFTLHNDLRKNPQSFIPKLKNWLNKFRQNTLYLFNENPLSTYEGIDAVKEAITFLQIQEPVEELIYKNELTKAAKDHAIDIGSHGLTGHEGSKGNLLIDRIEKYIEWDFTCAENLDFGFKEPENILMNMIVDDGSVDRNQRMNLFSKDFKFIGIGAAKHKNYNYCVVFVYAKGIRNLGQSSNVARNLMGDYIKKAFYKRSIVNKFQEDDPDAPDDTIEFKIVKCRKMIGGMEKKITKKIYTLKDQSMHIVEIEEN